MIKKIRQISWATWQKAALGILAIGLLTGFMMLALPNTPSQASSQETSTEVVPTAQTAIELVELQPVKDIPDSLYANGIPRVPNLHTKLPDRPRFAITKYTVQQGDTIFDIAKKFNLDPSTILWSNLEILGDDPHRLAPNMDLNILPLDGAIHKWTKGEGMNKVAEYYGVTPADIIDWPGNNLTLESVGDFADPKIPEGTRLVIPGGKREFISWTNLVIRRQNPGVASLLGPGACGEIAYGATGSGAFVNPTSETYLSGFDWSPGTNHWGVDYAGRLGNPLYAADTGVVVYSGWNNFGYGNVVVIDHGNGWQTLYAHMEVIYVGCGQSVYQGSTIGQMGSTGNSSGPHLHYEMMYEGTHMNPRNYLTIGASIYVP